jgi:hypothetical protein
MNYLLLRVATGEDEEDVEVCVRVCVCVWW